MNSLRTFLVWYGHGYGLECCRSWDPSVRSPLVNWYLRAQDFACLQARTHLASSRGGLGNLFGTGQLGGVALWVGLCLCRQAVGALAVSMFVGCIIDHLFLSHPLFYVRSSPISTRWLVWRRSCVLTLSCVECRAARLCTHRREGCSLCYRECRSSLALTHTLLTAGIEL